MNIKKGFALIDRDKCLFYKDGKDFIHQAVNEYLALDKIDVQTNVRHKIALIIGYTGLIFILLSVLRASIANEKQKTYVLYNKKIVVKKGEVRLNDCEKTIDTDELLKRLKGCEYEMEDLSNQIRKLGIIRNDIIHHFNLKPKEELLTHILTIFFIIKDIIPDPHEFWGENWGKLCEMTQISEKLEQECNNTYSKYHFTPHTYYFKCFQCASPLVSIEESEDKHLAFKCNRCHLTKSKLELIECLKSSCCYRDTHQVISFLTFFSHDFAEREIEEIQNAVENNTQVSDIITDDDIYLFFTQVFGEHYFE